MKLSDWEKDLIAQETCLLCQTLFHPGHMKEVGKLLIRELSAMFAFYLVACPDLECPFVMTMVMIRTQNDPASFNPSAVEAIRSFITERGAVCDTCGQKEVDEVSETVPLASFPAFWIHAYCQVCQIRKSLVVGWEVIDPLLMIQTIRMRSKIQVDQVLDAHEALRKVSNLADLFR